jgi:hypothetical protein
VKAFVRCLVSGMLLAIACLPSEASAHDDPVVTVRVLCNGFNVLDMDAVLGEISDSATLSVDRQVHGLDQIEQWVKEQMDDDLRIEILDIGTPQPLSDGYTLTWTGRFTRQDWRKAGIESKAVSNLVVIHNGHITEWTAKLGPDAVADGSASSAAGISVAEPAQASVNGTPQVFGIPISLVLAAMLAIGGAVVVVRMAMRG